MTTVNKMILKVWLRVAHSLVTNVIRVHSTVSHVGRSGRHLLDQWVFSRYSGFLPHEQRPRAIIRASERNLYNLKHILSQILKKIKLMPSYVF